MDKVRLIDIKKEILSENKHLSEETRAWLSANKVFMLNIMGSPGCGKTSFIVETIKHLKSRYTIAVVEADVDSKVDADKIAAEGVAAVQIRTGGFCHLEAAMMEKGLQEYDLEDLDIILVENIGNLICPAECDIGAHRNVVLLSIPEGDDKPLKYPLIFKVSHELVINKIDYLSLQDFDLHTLQERAKLLNPEIRCFPLSCKTGDGVGDWVKALQVMVDDFIKT
jgi:hydrogenase nickel incorporation protein HypB